MKTANQRNIIPPQSIKIATSEQARSGIISDVIVGLQTDRCTLEPCTRYRLLVRIPVDKQTKVFTLRIDTFKNFVRAYGDKLSNWYGQEVSICDHGNGSHIYPVIR